MVESSCPVFEETPSNDGEKPSTTGALVALLFCAALVIIVPLETLGAAGPEAQIEAINLQLQTAVSPKDQAKLYCYRARNHEIAGNIAQAKEDYFKALNTSYEGWILNELGYFMHRHGEYEKAYNISLKVLEDFPYLKKEAESLNIESRKMWDEALTKANPPTIIMDAEPDPHRVTRHDLIRQSKQTGAAASSATAPAPRGTQSTRSSSGGSHISGFGTGSALRRNYIESRKNNGK
jgi:tetratricopeptide (TPR) repeat protein